MERPFGGHSVREGHYGNQYYAASDEPCSSLVEVVSAQSVRYCDHNLRTQKFDASIDGQHSINVRLWDQSDCLHPFSKAHFSRLFLDI